MARILVVEDETDLRSAIREVLELRKHEVVDTGSVSDALRRLAREPIDALVTDLRLPDGDGLDVLREALTRHPDTVGIVITAFGAVDTAVQAMRLGAQDFLIKPVNLEALQKKLELLLERGAVIEENRFLRQSARPPSGLIGSSREMEEVRRLIARVAVVDSTVLITGETGSGKEVVARAIHDGGPRAKAPFVAVNSGSIPETLLESELFGHVKGAFTGADGEKRGLFEVAAQGTIFLDEIGELPVALQPKLLRTLESREILRVGSTSPIHISARILAATHRNLSDMIQKGLFRQDLYYRLNVLEIPIAPLRKRLEDIRPLVDHLLERLCKRMNRPKPDLDPQALPALETYGWPGNVRELANVLERALILNPGARIGLDDLPGVLKEGAPVDAPDDLRQARAAFEVAHIQRVVNRHGGDKAKAAAALGVDVSSLYRKLQ